MKKIKKNLKWITLIIVIIVITVGIIIKYSLEKEKNEEVTFEELELELDSEEQQADENKEETEIPEYVYVDIKGAVQNPGVYEISKDKKVIDVVQLAGGFTEQADTSMINLAKKVTNEMVIIIYTTEEVKKAGDTESIIKVIEKECICPEINNDACLNTNNNQEESEEQQGKDTSDKVNINTADLEKLQTLSGIGESKAKAIIEYRERNGNFEKIEDLMKVTGIGESVYEKIKNDITI